MTSVVPLPEAALPVVQHYRTGEFLTVTKSGVPIAWPTTTVYRPETGTFVLSTSIGLAQKAYNVRRDGRVALLFSDATGSGLEDGRQVLVQGTATCLAELSTSPGAEVDLWRRIFAFQPSAQKYPNSAVMRRIMDVYFLRLIITVTPDEITVRDRIPTTTTIPAELVRARPADDDAFGRTARELATFPTTVLTGFDSADRPTMARVSLRPLAERRAFAVETPVGFDLRQGAAGILSHSHNEKLWNLKAFVSGGRIERDAAGWLFIPATFTAAGEASSLSGAVSAARSLRRNGARYLDRHHLERPPVDWPAYRALVASLHS